MSGEAQGDLLRFVRGDADPATFSHREHVRMAFEMLRRHPFEEAVLHYSRALRAMTAKAGKPEAFHQTITIAFLAVIAERLGEATRGFDEFACANPDLLDKGVLARWYGRERLMSAAARRTFVLPEPQA